MLIVTGWLLWVFAPAIGKDAFLSMWYLHVWGSLFITVLVVCAHIPLALLSMSHFLGIWRIGTGDISWEAAEHHSPVWLEKDVIRTNIEKPDSSGLPSEIPLERKQILRAGFFCLSRLYNQGPPNGRIF